VRNTNISTAYDWIPHRNGFAVIGGKVSFEGTHFNLQLGTSFINTTATFFTTQGWFFGVGAYLEILNSSFMMSNSSFSSYDTGFFVSTSSLSMVQSEIKVADDSRMILTASMVNLTDSSLNLGHGDFHLQDSNATLTRSFVHSWGASSTSNQLGVSNSTVVAACDSRDDHFAVFESAAGVYVEASAISFRNCSCDASNALKASRFLDGSSGGIDIDKSSVHFEGCMASKEARPILV